MHTMLLSSLVPSCACASNAREYHHFASASLWSPNRCCSSLLATCEPCLQAGWTRDDEVLFNSLWPSADKRETFARAAPAVLVANKRDRVTDSSISFAKLPLYCHTRFDAMLAVSATERINLDNLEEALERVAMGGKVAAGGHAWAVNDRQADALVAAHAALLRVSESVQGGLPLDCWTIDMRDALHALGTVTGDEATEEVLDVVFSKFCIGK